MARWGGTPPSAAIPPQPSSIIPRMKWQTVSGEPSRHAPASALDVGPAVDAIYSAIPLVIIIGTVLIALRILSRIARRRLRGRT